ncbi:hypothetical protein ACFLZB_00200 [Nanoarchaeota archaeon]
MDNSQEEIGYKNATETLDQKFLNQENGIEEVSWREEKVNLEIAFKQLPDELQKTYQKDYEDYLRAIDFAVDHPDLMF